jgi:transcriptional regulator with XRE-family HTH domain
MAKKRYGNKVLKALRTETGLSQTDFGAEVDLGKIYICAMEIGKHRIGAEAALKIVGRYRRILEMLGYSLEDLMRSGR